MKSTCFYLLIALILTSCSHRIVRTGYQPSRNTAKNCEVPIVRNLSVSDSSAKKIGSIKLGESGFSMACSESKAIKILQKEACAINADLIVITEEKRPDLWSSCYRCKADFYKNLKEEFLENKIDADTRYVKDNVDQRVAKDRKRNTFVIIGAVLAGLAIGILISVNGQ